MRTGFLLRTVGLDGRSPRAVDRHTDAAISLGSEDGTMTCDVPSGLDLSALPVGARRKPHRHRPNGRLQAVVEVPH
jgi:hypothetical protein